jgi:hemerythrin superfamily protein
MQTQKSPSNREAPRRSSTSTAAEPTIFDLMVADHRAVAGLFEVLKLELEKDEPDAGTCQDLLAKIDALLTPHARAEEELIYPAFAIGGDEAQSSVAEGYEEHALVHQLCAELKEILEVDHVWCAKAKVMMDLVEHHVREEENELIPAARKSIKGDLALALASEFLAGKERIAGELSLPPPEALDLPPPTRAKPAAS